MKKKWIIASALCLFIGMASGCEKTPETVIVKEKGADNIDSYEKNEEDTGNALRESLGAPEHYTNKSAYEEGKLVIDTDAQVVIPGVSRVDTVAVTARERNQELIDQVTKAFFDGDKIYNAWSYTRMTKAQIEKQITVLKGYKAENNMDPYDYGTDEDGNLQYDIDQVIANYEKEYETAPEEPIKEEVTPAFGLEYNSGDVKGINTLENSFDGVAETDEGNFEYRIQSGGETTSDIRFQIEKLREREDAMEFTGWVEGEYLRDPEGTNLYLSEEKLKSLAGISYEEAEAIAKEKIEGLGMDLVLYNWDYAVFHHGEGGITEDRCIDGGYRFYFVKEISGVPITYTTEQGGGFESMDSTEVPWSYECCSILIGDDGIQQFELVNPYQIGEVQTENVKLMDFDSIMQIYEQMMEVSNANLSYEDQRTYHIRKIVLGYSRIYDPRKDSTSGLLVPVWDFFGGFDITMEGEVVDKNSGEYSNQSFMTINAVDGTVIDRGLGY